MCSRGVSHRIGLLPLHFGRMESGGGKETAMTGEVGKRRIGVKSQRNG